MLTQCLRLAHVGQCHIAMKFTGGSKEYSEKMSNEDFMAFKNSDNNPRKRRNYDDIDDMNDEERKGLSYR